MTGIYPKILWLASYPKSGNTWVRFLLINLLYGAINRADDIEYLIPDIHHGLNLEDLLIREEAIVKSHLLLNQDMPLLENTWGYIYIVRNPWDVIVSNFNYFLLQNSYIFDQYKPEEIDKIASLYFDTFIEYQGDRRWFNVGMGTLNQNVESWTKNHYNFPHLIIKYENLIENIYVEAMKICSFLKLELPETRVIESVNNSHISNMKRIEDDAVKNKIESIFYEPGFERSHARGFRFLNYGGSGLGKLKLSQKQQEAAYEVFFPIFKQFGYC